MKTLRQISEKYKITRQGLVKRIKKIPDFRKKYMTKHKGMWLIQDKAIHLINHKRQMVRPKHYKQSIDHIPTRYDLQQQLKQEREKNMALIRVLQSLQKTNAKQTDNFIKIEQKVDKQAKLPSKHGFLYRLFH